MLCGLWAGWTGRRVWLGGEPGGAVRQAYVGLSRPDAGTTSLPEPRAAADLPAVLDRITPLNVPLDSEDSRKLELRADLSGSRHTADYDCWHFVVSPLGNDGWFVHLELPRWVPERLRSVPFGNGQMWRFASSLDDAQRVVRETAAEQRSIETLAALARVMLDHAPNAAWAQAHFRSIERLIAVNEVRDDAVFCAAASLISGWSGTTDELLATAQEIAR